MARVLLIALALLCPFSLRAQGFRLTVENIMRGPDLVGVSPSNGRFSADGKYVYFRWRSPGLDTLDQDYRVLVSGGEPERLPWLAGGTIALTGGWSPAPP